MKYQCVHCRRIYSTHYEAADCCADALPIPDDQVVPHEVNGEPCDDDLCVFCQGTGLMMRLEPVKKET